MKQGTTGNAQHVEQVILTRIKMARRWFRLRSDDEIREFVLADPEVRTPCADKTMRQQTARNLVRCIARALASGDQVMLHDLKARLGEAYDDIVALRENRMVA